MTFCLDKWYADLVTADGTVCVVYLSTIRFGVFRHTYVGAEIFSPDGSRDTVRPSGPVRDWLESDSALGNEIRFPCDGGEFLLRYGPGLDAWKPTSSPAPGLDWWVEKPRASGELWWPGLPEKLTGVGYVDHVRLQRRLPGIGLERLDWGRVHLGGASLVYCGVSFRTGAPWRRVAWWSDDDREPRIFDEFTITPDDESLIFRTSPELTEATTILTPSRPLHAGPVVEAVPRPGPRERLAVLLIAGRLSDNRWISRAGSVQGSDSHIGWAVHEAVGPPGRTQLIEEGSIA